MNAKSQLMVLVQFMKITREKRSKQHLEEIGAKTTKRVSREEQVIEKP
jgi:hypothetical protein